MNINRFYFLWYSGCSIGKWLMVTPDAPASKWGVMTITPGSGAQKKSRGSEMPEKICPYFGKNEDFCDVGCGYISTHDVNMIIRFCSSQFSDCRKYQELMDRLPTGMIPCTGLN